MGEIFALGRRATATSPAVTDTKITVALAVHDLIVTLIHARQGELKDVAEALHARFGGEFAAVAEGIFHTVYGCDPYAFAARLVDARRA